jgi:mRNA-degrading endonuclease RelE of RelBE toxin-antitoxin system
MDFMPDDSDASFNTFIEAAKSEWSKLEKETQNQIDEKFPGMERFLGKLPFPSILNLDVSGKLTFDRALKQLPADQQKLYESFQRESRSDVERQIRLLAQMHKNNPKLYRVAQMSRQENVDKFDGGAKSREFLEYVGFSTKVNYILDV